MGFVWRFDLNGSVIDAPVRQDLMQVAEHLLGRRSRLGQGHLAHKRCPIATHGPDVKIVDLIDACDVCIAV
jgi:hypothetical protein